jgi:hypothetical protein
MLFILLSFVEIIAASDPKDFLQGFLSGFQGTEVQLGENCLELAWVNKVQGDAVKIINSIQKQDYFSVIGQAQTFMVDVLNESDDCHVPDLYKIYQSIQQLSLKDKIFRTIVHLNDISSDLQEVDIENFYSLGYHIGKVFSYLEQYTPIPNISQASFTDFFHGFFTKVLPKQTDYCLDQLMGLEKSIESFLESLVLYISGDESQLEGLKTQGVQIFTKGALIKMICPIGDLPEKIKYSFFTNEGLIASYIRFGMNIKKIQALKNKAFSDLVNEKFIEFGQDAGEVFNIIIN